ncbi:MAG: DUF4384 domain-containing protein [Acidobacteria bacterium]|nr:DUF4384 domain-containing protein [Acidobacteriota bacterium]
MTNKPSLVDFRALGPAAFVLLLALGHSPAAAQQTSSEDRTRQLWNTAFRAKRPAAPTPASTSTSTATAAPNSPAAPPLQLGEEDPGDSLVGITVWRLRPSLPEDDKDMRISSLDGGGDLTPERIEAETPLREGEKVRVSIEAARSGYLYVIDREQYADGSFGTPYLIFPTLRTHGGNNEVVAGRLVDIPAWDDRPRYFTMQPSRPDQTAEVLTILITPDPLPGLRIRRDPLRLTTDEVAAWEKRWGAKVQRLEARGQTGKSYTKAEKEAATDRTRLLTHDEPLPQTMYRLETKPGEPMLLNISLKIQQ